MSSVNFTFSKKTAWDDHAVFLERKTAQGKQAGLMVWENTLMRGMGNSKCPLRQIGLDEI